MKLLLTVEDAFKITGRGTILVPEIDLAQNTPVAITVEIRRPDGSTERCAARLEIPRRVAVPHFVVVVQVPKDRVPPGTEIWLVA